jgi:hypothetical protein
MFYDVWIMSTELKDLGRLVDLNRFTGKTICCMWNDGWDVARYLNGIARIIWYEDSTDEGATPDFAWRIWEGVVYQG